MKNIYFFYYVWFILLAGCVCLLFLVSSPYLTAFFVRAIEQQILFRETNFFLSQLFVMKQKRLEETLHIAHEEKIYRSIRSAQRNILQNLFPAGEKIVLFSPEMRILYHTPDFFSGVAPYLLQNWAGLVMKENFFSAIHREKEEFYYIVGCRIPPVGEQFIAILIRWIPLADLSTMIASSTVQTQISHLPFLGEYYGRKNSVLFFLEKEKLMAEVILRGYEGQPVGYVRFTMGGLHSELVRTVRKVQVWSLFGILMLIAVIALGFSHLVIYPLNILLRSIQRLSLPIKTFTPFPEVGPAELRRVSKALNLLLSQVVQATEQLKEKKEEIELFFRIGEVWRKHSVEEEVWKETLQLLQEKIPFTAGGIFLWNSESLQIEMRAQRGFTAEMLDSLRPLTLQNSLEGAVIQTGNPLVLNDYDTHPLKTFKVPGEWRHYVGIPLKTETLPERKAITSPSCEGMLALWGDQQWLTEKSTVDVLISVGIHLGNLLQNFRTLRREQFLEALVNNAFYTIPVGILIEDAQQKIQYANPELCRMLTYTPEELMGKEITKILSIEETIPTEIKKTQKYVVKLHTSGGKTKKIMAQVTYIEKGMRVWVFPPGSVL
ncbi:MAG: PAS domain-containing protein [bacterium JZ-2024 1]